MTNAPRVPVPPSKPLPTSARCLWLHVRLPPPVGGLFLFVPDLVRLHLDSLVQAAHLPGSKMIPAGHALRACLALKLWSIERHSHVMALAADEGLALFAGLNVSPKKSYLSEYSSRVSHTQTTQLLAAWHDQVNPMGLFDGASFNLDFHSVPYYGEDPVVERHFVSARSRRQPSILAFLAQDAAGRAFCYSNANLRKGEESRGDLQLHLFLEAHPRRTAPPSGLRFPPHHLRQSGTVGQDGDCLYHSPSKVSSTDERDRAVASFGLAHNRTRRPHPQIQDPPRLRSKGPAGRPHLPPIVHSGSGPR